MPITWLWPACIATATRGPNIASLDSDTGQLVPLFHPRKERWEEHFRLEGAFISALTPIGRVTVKVLKLNAAARLRERRVLIEAGRYPATLNGK